MNIYYQNHLNERVNLNAAPYRLITTDLLDYEWERQSTNDLITGFQKSIVEKAVEIDILPVRDAQFQDSENKLIEFFEKDVIAAQPGRLYLNDFYLVCYITASQKSNWETGVLLTNTFTVTTDSPLWIQDISKSFPENGQSGDVGGLDFPFDFSFDFAVSERGFMHWNIDHFTDSHFLMTIYGACTNPMILINDYPYEVTASLESNEYLTINSRENTIIQHLANGQTKNLFNNRQKQQSVFRKIPSGQVSFNWSGDFGFDLTLFLERSEPKWI